MIIRSIHNPKVQLIRRLQSSARTRRSEKSCVIEGIRLVEEAAQSAWLPRSVFHTNAISARGMALVNRLAQTGVPVFQIDETIMRSISDTQTPQGVLAVVPFPQMDLPVSPGFILIPDNIRDPGNLGTMLRTALAAGVELVIIPSGSVDPFSPKVMRSAMGAHFHLPLRQMAWKEIEQITADTQTFLAEASGEISCFHAALTRPVTLIIGGEAHGAGAEARKHADKTIHIPMAGKTESLNAAIAAAILMFEVVRQREAAND